MRTRSSVQRHAGCQASGGETLSRPQKFSYKGRDYVVVSPQFGRSVVVGMTIQSANDAQERDPKTVILSGSNADTAPAWDDPSWETIQTIDVPDSPLASRPNVPLEQRAALQALPMEGHTNSNLQRLLHAGCLKWNCWARRLRRMLRNRRPDCCFFFERPWFGRRRQCDRQ